MIVTVMAVLPDAVEGAWSELGSIELAHVPEQGTQITLPAGALQGLSNPLSVVAANYAISAQGEISATLWVQ